MSGSRDRVQRHRARKLAEIPEWLFDEYLDSLPHDRPPSEAGAKRFAAEAQGEALQPVTPPCCPHCGGQLGGPR
jgi:hypothetical protein